MCDIAFIDSLYSIAICRVALRHRAACQLTVNSYANMAIWCQPVLVFLSPRTAVLPTVTAKCQSYSQAQQVFGLCSYIDTPLVTPTRCDVMWCVLCIGVGDIVFHNGKRVFGQPQEAAQPARRHAVSPQSTSTYMCLCLYPCRLIFFLVFFFLLFCYFSLCVTGSARQTTWTNPHCNTKMQHNIS